MITKTTEPVPVDCDTLCNSCQFNLDPVCGSDGVSYPNECFFRCAKCKYNSEDMKIEHQGFCSKYPPIEPTEPPIIKTTDFPRGISPFSRNGCKFHCLQRCSKRKWRVCGTDGKTYKTACHLGCEQKCIDGKRHLKIKKHDRCPRNHFLRARFYLISMVELSKANPIMIEKPNEF